MKLAILSLLAAPAFAADYSVSDVEKFFETYCGNAVETIKGKPKCNCLAAPVVELDGGYIYDKTPLGENQRMWTSTLYAACDAYSKKDFDIKKDGLGIVQYIESHNKFGYHVQGVATINPGLQVSFTGGSNPSTAITTEAFKKEGAPHFTYPPFHVTGGNVGVDEGLFWYLGAIKDFGVTWQTAYVWLGYFCTDTFSDCGLPPELDIYTETYTTAFEGPWPSWDQIYGIHPEKGEKGEGGEKGGEKGGKKGR